MKQSYGGSKKFVGYRIPNRFGYAHHLRVRGIKAKVGATTHKHNR